MPIVSQLISDQPPRVLNERTQACLRKVIDVQRELVSDGYHVREQDLSDPVRPKVILHHGDALLQAKLKAVVITTPTSTGERVLFGTYKGVDLAWVIPS